MLAVLLANVILLHILICIIKHYRNHQSTFEASKENHRKQDTFISSLQSIVQLYFICKSSSIPCSSVCLCPLPKATWKSFHYPRISESIHVCINIMMYHHVFKILGPGAPRQLLSRVCSEAESCVLGSIPTCVPTCLHLPLPTSCLYSSHCDCMLHSSSTHSS